jgi:hypothetical protein
MSKVNETLRTPPSKKKSLMSEEHSSNKTRRPTATENPGGGCNTPALDAFLKIATTQQLGTHNSSLEEGVKIRTCRKSRISCCGNPGEC